VAGFYQRPAPARRPAALANRAQAHDPVRRYDEDEEVGTGGQSDQRTQPTADDRGERLNRRSLLLAGLVLVAGAVLGVAGFAVEQARATWRPQITSTARGWRVTQPYLGVNEPVLADGRLAWQAGPYTVMADPATGRSKLLGAAAGAPQVWPPSISADVVAWEEASGGERQQTWVFSYDIGAGRRRRRLVAPLAAGPVVAGRSCFWATAAVVDGDSNGAVVIACDLATGARRSLAAVTHFAGYLAADGRFVVWTRQATPQSTFTLSVLDLSDGSRHDVALPGQTSGSIFSEPLLADGVLVWSRTDPSGLGSIESLDMTSLQSERIAAGRGLVQPGFDGVTVAWAQTGDGGGDATVWARPLAGGQGPRLVAHVAAPVRSVLVSGRTVAWWAGAGRDTWVGGTELPR